MLKVNSILREVLAEEVEKLSDTRLELIAITGVDTAPNLRRAVVYVDALSDDHEGVLEALHHAAPRLQREIGKQVRIKYTPILEFEIDPGIAAGNKIDEILRSIHAEEE
jgi:ribosome-binding factor A